MPSSIFISDAYQFNVRLDIFLSAVTKDILLQETREPRNQHPLLMESCIGVNKGLENAARSVHYTSSA